MRETGACFVAGLSGSTEKTLRSLRVLERIPADHALSSQLGAIRLAGKVLEEKALEIASQ